MVLERRSVLVLAAAAFLFVSAIAASFGRASAQQDVPTPTGGAPIRLPATVTARPNGSIVHIVAPGETLWGIAMAYGTKMDTIRQLNGILPDSETIYVGQRLLIRAALASTLTPSPAPTDTETPQPPTQEPTLQPTGTHTAVAAASPTSSPAAGDGLSLPLMAGLAILFGGTLLVILAFAALRGTAAQKR